MDTVIYLNVVRTAGTGRMCKTRPLLFLCIISLSFSFLFYFKHEEMHDEHVALIIYVQLRVWCVATDGRHGLDVSKGS